MRDKVDTSVEIECVCVEGGGGGRSEEGKIVSKKADERVASVSYCCDTEDIE